MTTAALGQGKPDFSGTWELVGSEQGGKTYMAGKTFKETQTWVHKEPTFTIKTLVWDPTRGYRTNELTFTTNGKTGLVGYESRADGTKTAVNGSAHWDGNRLVYEQELVNVGPGWPKRLIRTCTLDTNGQKMVVENIIWMVGANQPEQAKWTWEKKTGTP